ncbi:hypothetical protein OE88DRAFT_1735359 [Heliocybe sulcata]|uniref:Uncharacterized protein n=1 Tax=Heliocybe sulcata TaxID=5364 RepID=A0A5C3N336_9AGAM|nr:hypothetical protein OE88DRAFT_1735359 [Heliocybe sulcata]
MPRAKRAPVVLPPPASDSENYPGSEPKKRKRRTPAEKMADDAALKVERQRKAKERKEAARIKAEQKQADREKAKAEKDAAKVKAGTDKTNTKAASATGKKAAARSKKSTGQEKTKDVLLGDETSASKKVAELEQKLAQAEADKNQGRITNIAQLQPPRPPVRQNSSADLHSAADVEGSDRATAGNTLVHDADEHHTLDPSSDVSMFSNKSMTDRELSTLSELSGDLSTEAVPLKKTKLAQTNDMSFPSPSEERVAQCEPLSIKDIDRTYMSEDEDKTPRADKPGKTTYAREEVLQVVDPVHGEFQIHQSTKWGVDGHSSHSPLVQTTRRAPFAATPTPLPRLDVHRYAPRASDTVLGNRSSADQKKTPRWLESSFFDSGDEDTEWYSALRSPVKTTAARAAQSKAYTVKDSTAGITGDSDSDSLSEQDEERPVTARQKPSRRHMNRIDDDEDYPQGHQYTCDEESPPAFVGDNSYSKRPDHAESLQLHQKEYLRPLNDCDGRDAAQARDHPPQSQRDSRRDQRAQHQDGHNAAQDHRSITRGSLGGFQGRQHDVRDSVKESRGIPPGHRGGLQDGRGVLRDRLDIYQDRRHDSQDLGGVSQDRGGILYDRRDIVQGQQGEHQDRLTALKNRRGILRDDSQDHRDGPPGSHAVVQDWRDSQRARMADQQGGILAARSTRSIATPTNDDLIAPPPGSDRWTTDMMAPGVSERLNEDIIPSKVISKKKQASKKHVPKSFTPEAPDTAGRPGSPPAATVDFFDEDDLDSETRSEITDEAGPRKKKRVTIADLPGGIGHDVRWNKTFIPTIYNYVATRRDPWTIGDEDFVPVLQELYNSVFRNDYNEYQVKAKDAIYIMTHKRLHDWRNGLGSAAIHVLEAHWQSPPGKFTTYSQRQAYAADAVKDYKFSFAQTYGNGDPSEWDGLLQGALILKTLAFHYSIVKHATIVPISAALHQGHDKAPVGAIGLAACAVERILRKWQRKEVKVTSTGEVKILPSNLSEEGSSNKATRGKASEKQRSKGIDEDATGSSFSAGDYGKKTRGWSRCAEQLDQTEVEDLIQSALQIAGGLARRYRAVEAYDSDEDERALLAVRRKK